MVHAHRDVVEVMCVDTNDDLAFRDLFDHSAPWAGWDEHRRRPDRPVMGPSRSSSYQVTATLRCPPWRAPVRGQILRRAAPLAPGDSWVTRSKAGPLYPHRRFSSEHGRIDHRSSKRSG